MGSFSHNNKAQRILVGKAWVALLSCAVVTASSAHAQTFTTLASFAGTNGSGPAYSTGGLRPALEDLIGAGAVISALPGSRSPEADLAVASFERFRGDIRGSLRHSSSGKELIERGFAADVDLAAELNVSQNVPRLVNRAFIGQTIRDA